jgi:thiol-disulfide isomerase/thioredoxin
MNVRSFVWGLLSGFFVFLIILVGFVIYSSLKIIPELEKLEQELDAPDSFESKLDNLNVKLINIRTGTEDSIPFSQSNKPIIINFWATWCKPCIIEMDSFERLYSKTKDEVNFYFLSNEPIEKQEKFILERGWGLPFFYYKDSILTQIGYERLPTTYIVKNQIIFKKHVGKSDWSSKNVIDYLQGLK